MVTRFQQPGATIRDGVLGWMAQLVAKGLLMETQTLVKKTSSSSFLLLFILQAFISFCLFYFWNSRDLTLSGFCPPLPPPPSSPPGPPPLTILLWTWPFHTPVALSNCSELLGVPDCHITADRAWYPRADAVILHHRDISYGTGSMPVGPRPPGQRWVWFNLESPSHSPNLGLMNYRFNLTMSYRHDSDIFTPYGWLEPLGKPGKVSVPPKTKLVAWTVSNWNPNSVRVHYYQELQKHLHVDVYGARHLALPRAQHLPILSQYKFYLAFENSLHEDYITEKLWFNALSAGAVPVVAGPPRHNYERFLPPDAFIHINDFPNASELARHLRAMDRDEVRYQAYFRWRERFQVVGNVSWNTHFCKACRALRETSTYRTVPNLADWFSSSSGW
ncbi:LOW QUALITY PROTEIN: 3-galactosyl-N-acetylglucosaminide 4-alpha-L-fucosyltransferase FUT3-like [Ornithorhynchus anatinus]|uniref:LOW QUALITY PROTEIN: 3-galactosyl-N-acetylglucosaminide 4-alpha-L-fucosyltransferase FUT3-like n=1 Tax=Ornithorhynchus anatinus TaxID=9258 RepID=UPI0010A8A0EA|nr:LOW QUALITY PROTEIN: 3-galactosyl-N-acetylglucosaminide 4-alpha-L-fucosyltransferase FUT3-like [Ornithorhynchus anatinus]